METSETGYEAYQLKIAIDAVLGQNDLEVAVRHCEGQTKIKIRFDSGTLNLHCSTNEWVAMLSRRTVAVEK